jgi:hypothetical protein
LPLALEAVLIPRRSFFISEFPFVRFIRKKQMSGHQQHLPGTALFCRCLSLGGSTQRQFPANRDYQLAISHRFGHELKSFRIRCREHRYDL